MADRKALDVLISARARIEQGWTQGTMKRNHVKSVGHWWKRTVEVTGASYCTVGALREDNEYGLRINKAEGYLVQAIQGKYPIADYTREAIIIGWNDSPDRTKEDVLALFDRAIILAKEANEEPKKSISLDLPPAEYMSGAKYLANIAALKYWPEPEPEPVKLDIEEDVKKFLDDLPDWFDKVEANV